MVSEKMCAALEGPAGRRSCRYDWQRRTDSGANSGDIAPKDPRQPKPPRGRKNTGHLFNSDGFPLRRVDALLFLVLHLGRPVPYSRIV